VVTADAAFKKFLRSMLLSDMQYTSLGDASTILYPRAKLPSGALHR